MASTALEDMSLDLDTRCSGQWVVGAPNSGKTNLLLDQLASDLQKDASIIVMDSKGELTQIIGSLALGDRLVVLDPIESPFAINPLQVQKTDVKLAVNQVEYIFGVLLDTTVTPKQKSFLRTLLRALVIGFPNANMGTVNSIIKYGWQEYKAYIPNLPPELQHFFQAEWGTFDATRSELNWRINLFMEGDLVTRLFNATETRYKVADGMDRGDVFVIDNSIDKLYEDGSAFLGRYYVSQIWSAAMARSRRPREKKKQVFVYIDEADLVIRNDPTIASILDKCRSQNISLICAMQRVEQLEHRQVRSALESCAIKMVNVDAEAPYFSRLVHIPEERMNRLPRGHFATFIKGKEPFIAQIAKAKLPYRSMTPAEHVAHRQRMVDLYGAQKPTGSAGSSGDAARNTKPLEPIQEKAKVAQSTLSSALKPPTSKAAADAHSGDHTEPASKWGDS